MKNNHKTFYNWFMDDGWMLCIIGLLIVLSIIGTVAVQNERQAFLNRFWTACISTNTEAHCLSEVARIRVEWQTADAISAAATAATVAATSMSTSSSYHR